MKPLKYLSFDALIKYISGKFNAIKDRRNKELVKYEKGDVLMAGLAMMFFQHPSLLSYQEKMKKKRGQSNLEKLFLTTSVPSDTQMREILDGVEIKELSKVLKEIFELMRRAAIVQRLTSYQGTYLIVLDATEYFSSHKIECPNCLHKTDAKGRVRYMHQVIPATIVKAGTHQILPLEVEEIINSDGQEKQDCEVNAAKRLIARLRKQHPKLKMTIGGDGIYSHEPMIIELRHYRFDFILVAKPGDHKEMFSELEEMEKIGWVKTGGWEERKANKRYVTRYRLAHQVPLTASHNTYVNFLEIWQEDKVTSELVYHNSWVTDYELTHNNVQELAAMGRARWKIENQAFNVHKNGGYEIEHNYGHGKETLSMVFYMLNLLAFTLHQILEMTDSLYLQAKKLAGGLRYLWEKLRLLMDIWPLSSWVSMLEISMLEDPVFDST